METAKTSLDALSVLLIFGAPIFLTLLAAIGMTESYFHSNRTHIKKNKNKATKK